MEEILLNRNTVNFGQAQGTPFTVNPIVNDIGYEGHTTLEEMRKKWEEQDDGVQTLLRKLTDGKKLLGIDDDLSLEEFTKGFKKWSEDTSTSPSGRHLGNYK
jgi:hypothetical protein